VSDTETLGYAAIGFRTPLEPIVQENWYLTLFADQGQVIAGFRVVRLACGHHHFTSARQRAQCARCQRMFDTGADWDGFRNHDYQDDLEWPEDPLRTLHERTEPEPDPATPETKEG
jgi:hypothetical protein